MNTKTYAENYSSSSPAICNKLEKATRKNHNLDSDILSGWAAGAIIQSYILAKRPKRFFEIGTFTGLSALYAADALPEGSEVMTVDKEDSLPQKLAREYWKKSELAYKIDFQCGDAVEVIGDLSDGSIGVAFIDGDNKEYQSYLEALLPKMEPGGVIIIDDTMDGDFFKPITSEKEEATHAFNEKLSLDPRFSSVIIYDRGEGVTVAIKR